MLRIALRVRLRLRSAQDDTEGGGWRKILTKNNPSVTLPRATSLCTKEAEVTFALNSYSTKLMKSLLQREKVSPIGDG